tara:strand:+ start:103 stop:384 length:282 start_codon:yes stop_codon:yes gene_type:complete
MTTLTNEKSTIETVFDNVPEDIQDMIYSKIVYPQPKELLQEIHTRGVIYSILGSLNREKDLKPTLDNVAIALAELPENKLSIILKKINKKLGV